MKTIFITIFFLFCDINLFSQKISYDEYSDKLLIIEKNISQKYLRQSLDLYYYLFNKYEIVYARDAFNALQISLILNDKNINFFLFVSAKSGVEKKTFLNNYLISSFEKSSPIQFDSIIKSGYSLYLNRIDTNLRKEFIARFYNEQKNKGSTNYKDICKDNFERIVALAESNKFPSEFLIGTDEELENSYVFATLQHWPYSYVKLKDYLWKSNYDGGTQPLSNLYLYGFNQTRTSRLYNQKIPLDAINFTACYNLPFGRNSSDIEQVNKDREKMKISSIEVISKIKKVAIECYIDYKFGY